MKNIEGVKTEVSELTDRTGAKVDTGIFDLVVALRLNGFKTIFSCEGHLDDPRWSRFFPNVILSYVEPFAEPNEEDLKKYQQKNLKMQSRLVNLLEQFYSTNKETSYRHRLICSEYIQYGTKLMPQSGWATSLFTNLQDREDIYKIYQNEIQKFTIFLLENYERQLEN